jgi:uncharacterized phage protein gp47/JayE
MAFERPTLATLVTRVEGDLKSGLELVTILRRSFLGVIARVLAGLAHSLFGYIKFIEKQAFPDTATDEYLERWASIWGVTRRAATFAEFTLDVTGTNGTVIPAGTVYRRSDGMEYTVDEEVTIAGGVGELALTANEAGTGSEVAEGDTISVLSPIAGLTSAGTVAELTTEPDDSEDDESLQARVVDRIQNPPSGGAANDYIQWALEVAGITRAWVGPQALGPGTVVVYIVSDDEDPITPSAPKIAEVQAYIDVLAPVTATVTVVAASLLPIDLEIAVDPNTSVVQDAIEAELEDLIARDAQLTGAYAAPGEVYDGKILLSRINEAISIGAGEEDHELIEINGGAPANVEPDEGYLAVLGEITWQPLA